MWIEVTATSSGQKFAINFDHVTDFYPMAAGSLLVRSQGNRVEVKEPYEAILELLKVPRNLS